MSPLGKNSGYTTGWCWCNVAGWENSRLWVTLFSTEPIFTKLGLNMYCKTYLSMFVVGLSIRPSQFETLMNFLGYQGQWQRLSPTRWKIDTYHSDGKATYVLYCQWRQEAVHQEAETQAVDQELFLKHLLSGLLLFIGKLF